MKIVFVTGIFGLVFVLIGVSLGIYVTLKSQLSAALFCMAVMSISGWLVILC